MNSLENDDVSIFITTTIAKIIGFWLANNRREKRIRTITLSYTLIAILFAVWVQSIDIYYSWGDFSACLFTMRSILSVALPLFKILVMLTHKEDFFRLTQCIQQKFLHTNYDDHETKIVEACKRQCTFFVCFLVLSIEATLASYVINPLIANIGRNESDRMLPFNMWVNLPLTITPYYEITFVLQVLSLYHIGFSYFCFDNFLCIMNLHAAAQFRILQYRLANMKFVKSKNSDTRNEKSIVTSSYSTNMFYDSFKKYIRQHQRLIAYCEKVEEVFNLVVLGQMLTFSVLICLDGYQVIMPDAPTRRRVIFVFHLSACLCQLLMFTYSCDCMIRESTSVADAAYNGQWSSLPATTKGMIMRKDLIIVIMKSSVPCCLTAKGFFIVSLQTYTGVLSTAVSYFTLLKQSSEAIDS